MLSYGNELIRGGENVRGAPAVRSQLEVIVTHWETITSSSISRAVALKNVLGSKFQEEVYRITVWINKKQHEVEKIDQSKEIPAGFSKYVQVTASL